MLRLFKDPVELGIDIHSDVVYFDPTKTSLVFGKVCVQAFRKLQITDFTVRLKGQLQEMFIDQYRLGNKPLGNHQYHIVYKKRFDRFPVINVEQTFNISYLPAETLEMPFELLVNLQHESIDSGKLKMDYHLEVEVVTKSNHRFKATKPILFYKLINISRLNYYGGIYYNYLNYELNIPDKLFLNNGFQFNLDMGPNFAKSPTLEIDLRIQQIDVDLVQCTKFKKVFNYTENHVVHQYSQASFETLMFRIHEIKDINTETSNYNFSEDTQIVVGESYLDQFGVSQTVHPSYKSLNLVCSHQLRLLITFHNGCKFKVVHPINILHSNINGSLAPPMYSSASSNAVLASNLRNFPPSYEMIEQATVITLASIMTHSTIVTN